MVVNSYTDINVQYNVSIQNGKAVNCNCIGRRTHKNTTCRHMSNADAQIELEAQKAQTFLSLKERYDVRSASNRRAAYVAMFNPCGIE